MHLCTCAVLLVANEVSALHSALNSAQTWKYLHDRNSDVLSRGLDVSLLVAPKDSKKGSMTERSLSKLKLTSSRPLSCKGADDHGWPRFNSQAELQSSKWAAYFTQVYGGVPVDNYPICTSEIWYLVWPAYVKAGITDHSVVAVDTYQTKGDLYYKSGHRPMTEANPKAGRLRGQSPYEVGYWIHHKEPFHPAPAIKNNTWFEVVHLAGGDTFENKGMWFLYSPGSGVWFNAGRTLIIHSLEERYSYCNGTNPHERQGISWAAKGDWSQADSRLAECASLRGFDSVQFVADWGEADYIEIMATNLQGKYACGRETDGAVPEFRVGWQANLPCHCNNSQDGGWLNCAGVPNPSTWVNSGPHGVPGSSS